MHSGARSVPGGMRAHWTKVQYIVHWGLVKFILSLRYPIAGVIVSTSQAAVFLSVQSCFSRAQLVRVVLRIWRKLPVAQS